MEKSDQERSRFNRDLAGRPWEDPRNFDLILDASREGIDGCAMRILEAALNLG